MAPIHAEWAWPATNVSVPKATSSSTSPIIIKMTNALADQGIFSVFTGASTEACTSPPPQRSAPRMVPSRNAMPESTSASPKKRKPAVSGFSVSKFA